MSLFKDTFKRTTASKDNDKKALELLSKKKSKQTPVATVVPKTIKQKVLRRYKLWLRILRKWVTRQQQ